MRFLLVSVVVAISTIPATSSGDPPRFPASVSSLVLAEFLQRDPGISSFDRVSGDPNLAAYAFWQDRVRSDYGRVGGRGREFAAFIEGRLRVAVPSWWTRSAVRGAVFPGGDNFNRELNEYRSRWTTKNGFTFSGPQTVAEINGTLTLTWNDRSCQVKRSDLASDGMPEGRRPMTLVANSDPGRLYLILDDLAEATHGKELLSVDTSTGKVEWRRELTAYENYPVAIGGNLEAYSEITIENELVTVFGGKPWGLSIAAFRARDGEPVLNFYSMLLDPGYLKAEEERTPDGF